MNSQHYYMYYTIHVLHYTIPKVVWPKNNKPNDSKRNLSQTILGPMTGRRIEYPINATHFSQENPSLNPKKCIIQHK